MSSSEPLDIKNYIGLTGDTPIRFIASDVDGTLVNDAKSVDPEVVNAVRAARESGIRVASHRAVRGMRWTMSSLPCRACDTLCAPMAPMSWIKKSKRNSFIFPLIKRVP